MEIKRNINIVIRFILRACIKQKNALYNELLIPDNNKLKLNPVVFAEFYEIIYKFKYSSCNQRSHIHVFVFVNICYSSSLNFILLFFLNIFLL